MILKNQLPLLTSNQGIQFIMVALQQNPVQKEINNKKLIFLQSTFLKLLLKDQKAKMGNNLKAFNPKVQQSAKQDHNQVKQTNGVNNQSSNSESNKQIKKVRPPSPAQKQQQNQQNQNININEQVSQTQKASQQQIQKILQHQQQQQQQIQQKKQQQQYQPQLLIQQTKTQIQNDEPNLKKLQAQNQQLQSYNTKLQNQNQQAQSLSSSYLKNLQQQNQIQKMQQTQEVQLSQNEPIQQQKQVQINSQVQNLNVNLLQSNQPQSKSINVQQNVTTSQLINSIKEQYKTQTISLQQTSQKHSAPNSENIASASPEDSNHNNHASHQNGAIVFTYIQNQRKNPNYKREFTPLLKSRQQQEIKTQADRPESAPRPVRGESPQRQIQRQAHTPSRNNDKQARPLFLTQSNQNSVPLQQSLNGNLTSSYDSDQKKRAPIKQGFKYRATVEILQKNKQKQAIQTQHNIVKNKPEQKAKEPNQIEKKVIVRPSTATGMRQPSPTPGIKYGLQQQSTDKKPKIITYQNVSTKRSVSSSQASMRQSLQSGKKS